MSRLPSKDFLTEFRQLRNALQPVLNSKGNELFDEIENKLSAGHKMQLIKQPQKRITKKELLNKFLHK